MEVLISEGIENVKVQRIAQKLDCPRSSFYWYFKDRSELLSALLQHWKDTNTNAITQKAALAAETVNSAVINVCCCWVNSSLFDPRLDFAIRDWGTRDFEIGASVEKADDDRVYAISTMFARYGYSEEEAFVRGRILYFTQIGYYALKVKDADETRAKLSPQYIFCHTGQYPTEQEMQPLYNAFDTKTM
nr:TetR/AcrR family transcriptional regulator [Ruegeria atlantica]